MNATIESNAFWQQHLDHFSTSGLSRSSYCKENSVNYDRFGYWLKKLNKTSTTLVPVKIQAAQQESSLATLATLEWRGSLLKIHDLSALSFIIEKT